ncbi:MAG: HEAT repeat domain-containing protein, partial [Gammaproteobacteria bacterium]
EEAVEELAALDMAAAMEHLVQLVQIDPNERVRRQALEEMENGTAATAVPFLMAVSNDRDGQSLRVRQEAVASLGAFDLEDVRDHLNTLAWSDEQERIRKQAIESLADMTSNGSHALLLELARSHPSADTREEAMEQLTDKLDLDF